MNWDLRDIPDRYLLDAARSSQKDDGDPIIDELKRRIAEHPELAIRLRESQDFDRELAQLISSVPLSVGLEGRILKRLGKAADVNLSAVNLFAGKKSFGRSLEATEMGTAPRRLIHRRWWLIAMGGGVTAAAVAGVAVWLGRRLSPQVVTAAEVAACTSEVFEQTLNQFGTGRSLRETPPPPGYFFSREIRLFPATSVSWRQMSVKNWPAVVFDLTQPGGEQGSLFAFRFTQSDFPPFPPDRPLLQTSRSSLGWWQEVECCYILAVLGGPAVYRRFLRPPGPIT